MPRARRRKSPRLLDVLPSLVKMVPVVRLERIEETYPVFQERTICLKRGSISLQRAARPERNKVATIDNVIANKKSATNDNLIANKKPATNGNLTANKKSATSDNIIANKRPATNDNITANKKPATNDKLPTNDHVPIPYKVPTDDKVATSYKILLPYKVPNNSKAPIDEKDKVPNNDKVGTNYKILLPYKVPHNSKAPTDVKDKVATNDKVRASYKAPINYKLATNCNMLKNNDDDEDDDDVNDDALFEYEVDFDNLAQDVTITTELINDEKEESVVAVNLVPETRTATDMQEEELPDITSSGANTGFILPSIVSVMSGTNADFEQNCEDIEMQMYTPNNGDMEHVESNGKGNAENQDSDDDIIFILDVKKQETENKEQQQHQLGNTEQQLGYPEQQPGIIEQQLGNTEQQPGIIEQQLGNTEKQPGNTEQQSGSEPVECMSILSTSWALADCVPTKSQAHFTEEVEVIDDDDNDNGDVDNDNALSTVNYQCMKCNQSFCSPSSFSSHTCNKSDVNQAPRRYLCPQCENGFESLKELKQHVKNCWNGMLSCVICSTIIFGKIGAIKHLQEHKKKSPQTQTREKACLVCGLFDEKWKLIEHWRAHTGVNLSECVVCKKVFAYNYLQSHLASHRESNPAWADLNWCHICGLTFLNKGTFFNHKNGHATKRYSHLCEKCGLFFENFDDLEQHTLYHVDQNTIYKCTKCNKIYPFQAHFDIHCKTCFKLGEMDLTKAGTQALLRGIREKYLKSFNTHTLDLIRYAFKKDAANSAYNAHAKQINKPHNIKVPLNEASTKQIEESQVSTSCLFIVNLRKEDSTVLLYACQVCQRKFFGKESFMRHWRDHTGYDPNKCVICSEIFAVPKLLEIHMSIAHSSCFKCSTCSMIFKTGLDHKYHTIGHMKKNVYFCEVCGAGFDRFNYLEYHVFTHHVKGCQVRNSPPNAASAPVADCSTSTQETRRTMNGRVRNTSPKNRSKAAAKFSATVAGGIVADTSHVQPPSVGHSTTTSNFSTSVAGAGVVNLQSPVISNSYISNSSAVANQLIPIINSSSLVLNAVRNILPKQPAVQQTREVVHPPLPDLYLCTVCKVVAPDLSTMMEHSKTHEV